MYAYYLEALCAACLEKIWYIFQVHLYFLIAPDASLCVRLGERKDSSGEEGWRIVMYLFFSDKTRLNVYNKNKQNLYISFKFPIQIL